MNEFRIEGATDQVLLDGSRRGQASFTVFNDSHQNLTVRARVVTEGQAEAGWFTVADAERPSPVDSELPFTVQVAVPAGAPAGSHRFRLEVVAVEDPDEYSGEGPWTTVVVPARSEPRPFPWRWILLGAGAVLVVAAATVVAWILTHPAQGELQASASISDFGTVQVGQGSLPSVVTVTNSGGSRLRMGTAVLTGASAADFVLLADGCKDWELEAKATCTIQVAFAPKTQGSKETGLRIVGGERSVELTFKGKAQGVAVLRFEPPQIVIVTRQGRPAFANLVVRNAGTGNLKITQAQFQGQGNVFRSNLATCSNLTLGPGQTCMVTVDFLGAGGTFSARFVFTDDQPGSPHVVPITATGFIGIK